ncbi:MAG TPA: pyrophosphate--fructose-6-phosphate 1-phosphotransferase [Acidimicrobiales bacterium]|nr:pyrophosphate--fructose-6-phosphate 1-phosphotransferase [Acidimicrobiales bacterium]
MTIRKVAMLTAGGLAPCLSSAVGALIAAWAQANASVELIAYRDGYAGLLKGDSVTIGEPTRAAAGRLQGLGGSPIGNSRVKFTNVEDCRRRGLVGPEEIPLEVAARRLADDNVDVLHTIGGDDTSTAAADLASYLAEKGYQLTVVGLPKTIDNDIVPIRQSLGAATAAEESAAFARHIVAEHSANPRMLVIHEVMGRHCGWLTAMAASRYHDWASAETEVPGLVEQGRWDVHGVYVPERPLDVSGEVERLAQVMERHGGVNLFVSEGAGAGEIVEEMERSGQAVPRDAFGHVKLDAVNPGQWLAKRLEKDLGAEKTLVGKSGYFARSAPANEEDRKLIASCVEAAVAAATDGISGLVGEDEERGDQLRVIEFARVKGGKPFDAGVDWFAALLADIGQI